MIRKVYSKNLDGTSIQNGLLKLERRISELENFDIGTVTKMWDAKVQALEIKINDTIAEIFGEGSAEYNKYEVYLWDDDAIYSNSESIRKIYQSVIRDNLIMMKSLKDTLSEKLGDMKDDISDKHVGIFEPKGKTKKDIFIVHGHDEAAKQSVARFISQIGLNPIILHEMPNRGRTIIEKLEYNADVGFAIIILTPDDVGCSAQNPNAARPRARQNVILELGLFLGLLGRERVCALSKGDIELPSDYQGVLYVQVDEDGGWKLKLARELKHSDLNVDLNQIIMS